MLKHIKSQIPNTITCLNLISGCIACILSFSCNETIAGIPGYEWVFIFIAISAIFDFCDGGAARLLKAYSDLGKELDSLADLISFGLAPSLLMFNTMNMYNDSSWTSYIALVIVVGGALRLAKFNIDENQATTFKGLPIPANAIFWVGFCSWIHTYEYPGDWLMIILLVSMALLMISKLKMASLKFKNFNLKENLKRYIIILAAILLVALMGIPGLAVTICFYCLISYLTRKSEA